MSILPSASCAKNCLAILLCLAVSNAFSCITPETDSVFSYPKANLPRHCKPIDKNLFEQRFNHGLLPEHQFVIEQQLDLNWDGQCEALIRSANGHFMLIRQVNQAQQISTEAMQPQQGLRLETIANLIGDWQANYYRDSEYGDNEEQEWISFTTRKPDEGSPTLLWRFNGKEYRVTEDSNEINYERKSASGKQE